MSSTTGSAPVESQNGLRLVSLLGVLVACAAGALLSQQPALAILGVAAVLGTAVTIVRPELGACAVAFLLYTNGAVVAVRFHGLPYILGVAYLALLFVPIGYHLFVRRMRPAWTPAMLWMAAFLLVQILGMAFSEDPSRSKEYVTEYILEGIVVYVLIVNAIRDMRTLQLVTWTLLIAGAFMGGLSVLQQLLGAFDSTFGGFAQVDSSFGTGEVTTQGAVSQARLAGPLGEKNRYGQIMLVLVPLGISQLRGQRSRSLGLTALAATALCLAGAALTFSRGTAVAFAVLGLAMLVLGIVSSRQAVTLLLLTGVVVLALPQFRSRLATLVDIVQLVQSDRTQARPDAALRGRATEVLGAVLVFADHPVLGVGPGMFPAYSEEYGNSLGYRRLRGERQAHSLLPHIAAENGLLGLLAFLGASWVTMKRLWKGSRLSPPSPASNLRAGYLLALIAYFATGLFLHFTYVRYFWFLLALASVAASRLPDLHESDSVSTSRPKS